FTVHHPPHPSPLPLHDALPISAVIPSTTTASNVDPTRYDLSGSPLQGLPDFCFPDREPDPTPEPDPDPSPDPQPGMLVGPTNTRSEEHTSELQSRENLVCRLLL